MKTLIKLFIWPLALGLVAIAGFFIWFFSTYPAVPPAEDVRVQATPERLARGDKVLLVAKAAQHLEQHQICHRQWRCTVAEQIRQSLDARIIAAVEEVDPDRGVDQDHAFSSPGLARS